jgi:preprotein translocase subunit SecE
VDKIKGWITQAPEFFREVGVELKKVTWPTRKETVGSTAVVLVMALAMAVFFWVVDIALTWAVALVL